MSQQKVKISDKAEGIVQDYRNNFVLGRREIKVKIYHYGSTTPSREEVKKAFASYVSTKPSLVVVKEIKGEYGTALATAEVMVYDSEEKLKRVEPDYIIMRGTKKEKQEGEKNG